MDGRVMQPPSPSLEGGGRATEVAFNPAVVDISDWFSNEETSTFVDWEKLGFPADVDTYDFLSFPSSKQSALEAFPSDTATWVCKLQNLNSILTNSSQDTHSSPSFDPYSCQDSDQPSLVKDHQLVSIDISKAPE
jgi:hypothetical protein